MVDLDLPRAECGAVLDHQPFRHPLIVHGLGLPLRRRRDAQTVDTVRVMWPRVGAAYQPKMCADFVLKVEKEGKEVRNT